LLFSKPGGYPHLHMQQSHPGKVDRVDPNTSNPILHLGKIHDTAIWALLLGRFCLLFLAISCIEDNNSAGPTHVDFYLPQRVRKTINDDQQAAFPSPSSKSTMLPNNGVFDPHAYGSRTAVTRPPPPPPPASIVLPATPTLLPATLEAEIPALRIANNVNTSGLLFSAWPMAETRARAPSQRRTVLLTGLPPSYTFENLTYICRGAGVVERFHILDRNRAQVHFVNQSTADDFLRSTINGVPTPGGGCVFVDRSENIDVITGQVREAMENGARRSIRVVGLRGPQQVAAVSKELNYPVPLEVQRNGGEAMFKYLAQRLGMDNAKRGWMESALVKKNAAGYMEGRMVFGRTDIAIKVLIMLRRSAALEECNITYGDDP
jgi:hypothetical protein